MMDFIFQSDHAVDEETIRPLVNDVGATISHPWGVAPKVSHKTLWQYFENSPEIVGIISAIVEDIISDGWTLEGGRNNKKNATKFLEENKFKQLLISFLYDVLVTGDGYLYKVRLSPKQVHAAIRKIVNSFPFENKSTTSKMLYYETMNEMKAVGDNIYTTKNLRYVPSSTFKIRYNLHGDVLSYIQLVANRTVHFAPEEIIHFHFQQLDGQVYGFTPLQTLFTELDILSDIKDYERFFFNRGGVPNFMFILKNETPNSPTTQQFKKHLQTYASLMNKWKSLVLTGEIDVKEVNKLDKDMEFRELSRYITQILVMTWGVPSTRLSDMLISKGTKGQTVSTEGYYRKISHYQDLIENLVNTELLNDFDVLLRFNRTYKQDEVREAQVSQFKSDIVEKNQNLLKPYEKRLKLNKVLHILGFNEKDIEKGKAPTNTGTNRQDLLNNAQLLSESEDKLAEDRDKQSVALQKT